MNAHKRERFCCHLRAIMDTLPAGASPRETTEWRTALSTALAIEASFHPEPSGMMQSTVGLAQYLRDKVVAQDPPVCHSQMLQLRALLAAAVDTVMDEK